MEVIQPSAEKCIFNVRDVISHRSNFQQNKFLVIENFIAADYVKAHFLPEIEQCMPSIHRVKVASFKKSGSVSSQLLKKHAPQLFALYHSSAMKYYIEKIVGEPLHCCPEDDPHSVALYCYTEPGDHIGVHYDKSFYRGRRYTVLLGLIQDSVSSKLVCYPGATKLNRRKNPMDVYTHPGTLVVFEGNSLWHEVTPLSDNEKRIILTMEFVTDSRMTIANRFISTMKDRFLYFGKN